MNSATATPSKAASFTAPFRHTAFTVIWTATVVSNVGGWMYSAASGWLMTGLNPDPLIVALVQAASSLPICLFATPAGALADIFDKRKISDRGRVAVHGPGGGLCGDGRAWPGHAG
jgi:MFS family permease